MWIFVNDMNICLYKYFLCVFFFFFFLVKVQDDGST